MTVRIEADPLARAEPFDAPIVLEWERAKVGDRLAAFAMLLPAEPTGAVVLAVPPLVGAGLSRRFADAVLLARETDEPWMLQHGLRSVWWDGQHLPLRAGGAGLVVVDTRLADPELMRPALAPDGTLAVLGHDGRLAVYPDADRPEVLWQRGWPVPPMPTPKAQVRRGAALHGLRRNMVRLDVRSPAAGLEAPTLADRVLDDLATHVGARGEIIGVHTAGNTILRVRTSGVPDEHRELAVRLSLTEPRNPLRGGTIVAQEVPAAREMIQQPLTRGTTCGVPWVATSWLPRRTPTMATLRRATRQRWNGAVRMAEALSTVQTGETYPGWAGRWCASVAPIVPANLVTRVTALVAPLDAAVPTGWAHGDLWSANVLVEGGRVAVIDWDNAIRNAPLGIDAVLIAALRRRVEGRESVAAACAALIDAAHDLPPVAGRAWDDWDRRHRAALVSAAFVLHLRNRALFDLGLGAVELELGELLAVAEPAAATPAAVEPTGTPGSAQPRGRHAAPDEAPASDASDEAAPPVEAVGESAQADEPPAGGSGTAVRGAVWLGSSALVVKALQTGVLLVFAALLAPSALGLIAIATLVINVSTVLSDLGTSTSLVYWRGDARRAARSGVTVAFGLSLAITVIAWVFAPTIVHQLRVDDQGIDVIRGMVVVLPCYGMATAHLELLRRNMRFGRRIVPDVVATVAGTTVSIVLVLQHHGISALVVGQIVQGVLTLLVAWAMAGPIVPGWRWDDVRGLISYGGHLSGSNLAQLVLLNVDYLLVSRILGSADLGQYSLAFRLAYLPYVNVAFVVAGAAFPYLCRLRGTQLGLSAQRMTGMGITLVVPLCVGVVLLADQLELLGTKWAPAVPVVRWLMIYTVLLSVSQMLQIALNAAGLPRMTFAIRGLHVLALTAALLVLTPHGIVPVAFGQVFAVAIVTAVTLAQARRKLPGFRVTDLVRSLVPAVVGAVAMTAVVLVVGAVLPEGTVSVSRLIVLGLLGIASYAAAIWWLDRARIVQTVAQLRGAS